eukprot:352421-Chlamydomonas_euryale.AAC.11
MESHRTVLFQSGINKQDTKQARVDEARRRSSDNGSSLPMRAARRSEPTATPWLRSPGVRGPTIVITPARCGARAQHSRESARAYEKSLHVPSSRRVEAFRYFTLMHGVAVQLSGSPPPHVLERLKSRCHAKQNSNRNVITANVHGKSTPVPSRDRHAEREALHAQSPLACWTKHAAPEGLETGAPLKSL